MTTLLDAVRRHADLHTDAAGLGISPIPGLMTVRAYAPSGLQHAISKPMVCLVVQGSKNVTMGAASFDFSAGDSLLITADVPIASQITRASLAAPYLSLVLELDRAAGSPADVMVNGRLIARGEVVVIDEEFGIRITEIARGEDGAL